MTSIEYWTFIVLLKFKSKHRIKHNIYGCCYLTDSTVCSNFRETYLFCFWSIRKTFVQNREYIAREILKFAELFRVWSLVACCD